MVARVLQALGIAVFILTAFIAFIAWFSGMPLLISVYILLGGLFGSVTLFFGMAVLDHLKAIRDALEGQQSEHYMEQEHEVEHYAARERHHEPNALNPDPYVVVPEWKPRQSDWL
jgi:hypothetical protein